MKILASADWHIKLGQKGVPTDWAINRYKLLFKELYNLESSIDLHIIMGDIFDKLPSMEELELYFEFISRVSVETLIIPGNHEAIKKNTTFLSNLKTVTSKINNLVRIIDNCEVYRGIDFLPYNYLKDFTHSSNILFPDPNNILISHFRAEIPPHVKPEVPLELFDRWKVVLAGDLHSYDNCQRNILYPGSPVTTSFHRGVVHTGVIVLDTDTLNHEFIKLDLPQLIRTTVKAGDPTPKTDFHHTVYEIEGDLSELSGLEDNELIDRKIVKRSSDVSLMLDPEMSLADEVKEYLMYILELPENTIELVMKEFFDVAGSIE